MGNIITFYSYKGGVGRSMALANIGYELAAMGQKVLLVDWDLEAPGLERYFNDDSFEIVGSPSGLLQFLLSLKSNDDSSYLNYCWKIHSANKPSIQPITLLTSGRGHDAASYSKALASFNWDTFFTKNNGGDHLEKLRDRWKSEYDHVLIDSRTGLSDVSGICTILMPDVLIPMFTANYQSLFGINDAVQSIQIARQKLEVDRMGLTILPIPSRFGTRVEFKQSQEWLDRIANILEICLSDWLPRWIEPRYVFEQIKIPQMDFFSFGERLAVVEHGTSDPEGMGYVYSKIAHLIASEFEDVATFVGRDYYALKKEQYKNLQEKEKSQKTTNFEYDVCISYPREAYEWVNEYFLPTLGEYLGEELGYNPKIWVDFKSLGINDVIKDKIKNGIQKSKTFVIVLSEKLSVVQEMDFDLFMDKYEARKSKENVDIIFPVLLKKENNSIYEFPDLLQSIQHFEFDQVKNLSTRNTRSIVEFGKRVEELSKHIASSIRQLTLIETSRSPENYLSDIENIKDEFRLLGREYESLRKNMLSGYDRTRQMENIVSRMKSLADGSESLLPDLTTSKRPGDRLAAIAILQVKPDLDYLLWLSERVGEAEKPFIGYQSCTALFIATRTFAKNSASTLRLHLNKATENIIDSKYRDPNQINALNAALRLIE